MKAQVSFGDEPTPAAFSAIRENASYQRSVSALVLVDSSLYPVSYNTEAIRVLTYPQDPNKIRLLRKYVESKIRSLFPLHVPPRTPPLPLQSGRRRYEIRMFTLSDDGDQPLAGTLDAAYALLLDRQERPAVDISAMLQRFGLTPREAETLRFLLEGMTSKEIAVPMGISPHTVKAFLRLVMSKMQVSTRSGIIGKIVRISPETARHNA